MRSPAPSPRAWQRMLSGRRLDLLDPRPDDIAIEDIAHGLARVARWNGQTAGPHIYSVAQHSLLVEQLFSAEVPPEPSHSLAALLHDAPEYVVGDLISPFKSVLGDGYKAVEHRILAAVHSRFGVGEQPHDVTARIKDADRAAARLEASTLAGFAEAEADLFFGAPRPDACRWQALLTPKRADDVQALFVARFTVLAAKPEARP